MPQMAAKQWSSTRALFMYIGIGLIFACMGVGAGAAWEQGGLEGKTVKDTLVFPDTLNPTNLTATDQGVFQVSLSSSGPYDDVVPKSNGLPPGAVNALAFDPSGNPNIVYAATSQGVYKTVNRGDSWVAFNGGMPQEKYCPALTHIGPYLYAAIPMYGVYKSDGNGPWTPTGPLAPPNEHAFPYSLQGGLDGLGAPLLLSGTSGWGLVVTYNGGTNWNSAGLTSDMAGWVNHIATDPLNPGTWYAGNGDATATPGGTQYNKWMYVTHDYGSTWVNPFNGSVPGQTMNHPVTAIHTLLLLERSGESIPAGDSPVFLGTEGGRVWQSLDGGATWTDLSPGLPAETQVTDVGHLGGFLLAGVQGHGYYKLALCNVTCDPTATPNSGLAPLTVSFASNVQAPGCGGGPLFAWTFGDGSTSQEMNPTHTYTAPDTYMWNFSVTVDGKTCSQTGTITVSPSTGTLFGAALAGSTGYAVTLDGPNIVSAAARLTDPLGAPVSSVPVTEGTFAFHNLQPGSYNLFVDLTYLDHIPYDSNTGGYGCPHPPGESILKAVTSAPVSVQVTPGSNYADVHFPPPAVFLHGAPGCYKKWYGEDPQDPDFLKYWDNAARAAGFISFTPSYTWLGPGTSWTRMASQVAEQLGMDLMELTRAIDGVVPPPPPAALVAFDVGGLVARSLTSGPRRDDPAVSALQGIYLLGTPNSGTDLLLGGAANALSATNFIVRRFNQVFPDFGSKTASVYAIGGNNGWWRLTNSDGRVSLYSAFNIARLSCGSLSASLQACTPYTAVAFPSGPGHIFLYTHGELGSPHSTVDVLLGMILPLLSATITPGTPESPAGSTIWGTGARTSGNAQGSLQARMTAPAEFPFKVSATDGLGVIAYATSGSATFELINTADVATARAELSAAQEDGGVQITQLDPDPGDWKLSVTPGPEGTTFQAVFLEDGLFGIKAYTDKEAYRPGTQVILRLDEEKDYAPGAAFTGASATITDPSTGAVLGVVPLFDDGNHQDGDAGDGLFGNTYTAPSSPGSYPVLFKATGSYLSREFERTALDRLNVIQPARANAGLFTGTFADQAVDTDGDGIFDAIRFTAQVDLPSAGSYVLEGDLTDADGDFLSHATAFKEASGAGLANLDLLFHLRGVTCSQFLLPLQIDELRVLDGYELAPLDRWDDPVDTDNYDGAAFGCSAGAPGPVLATVRPDQAVQGQTLKAVVSGRGFKAGATLDFGPGVTVNRVVWLSPVALAASLTLDPAAALGPRTVTETNPGGAPATLPAAFEVVGPAPPMVTLQAPSNGALVKGDLISSATATDLVRVAKVELLVDGIPVGEAADFPFRFSWNSRSVPNGPHSLSARATGASGLTGTSLPVSISVSNSGIPGDCDGNGTVSIGEVQKAINMFLGSIPPDCGVDCNGDGTVSIGEVQKVINAFLGLTNSC
jgi:hypothetical protein